MNNLTIFIVDHLIQKSSEITFMSAFLMQLIRINIYTLTEK